jgi:hypothetical protein
LRSLSSKGLSLFFPYLFLCPYVNLVSTSRALVHPELCDVEESLLEIHWGRARHAKDSALELKRYEQEMNDTREEVSEVRNAHQISGWSGFVPPDMIPAARPEQSHWPHRGASISFAHSTFDVHCGPR